MASWHAMSFSSSSWRRRRLRTTWASESQLWMRRSGPMMYIAVSSTAWILYVFVIAPRLGSSMKLFSPESHVPWFAWCFGAGGVQLPENQSPRRAISSAGWWDARGWGGHQLHERAEADLDGYQAGFGCNVGTTCSVYWWDVSIAFILMHKPRSVFFTKAGLSQLEFPLL